MKLNKVALGGIIAFSGSVGLLPLVVSSVFLLPAMIVAFGRGLGGHVRFNNVSLAAFCAAAVWIIAVWLSVAVGGLVETYPDDSLKAAARFTGSFLVFVLAYAVGRRDLALTLIGFVVVSATHGTIATIELLIGGAADIHGQERAAGALTPNVLANLLGFGAICWYGLRWQLVENRWPRRYLLITGAMIAAGLVAAGTLKNIVVLAALFSGYYIISSGREMVIRAAAFLIAALLASPLLLLSERITRRAVESFLNLFSHLGWVQSFTPSVEATDSLLWRYRNWEQLLGDWLQNYYVLGSGIGQARNMEGVRAYYNEEAAAHSDWVATLIEGGMLLTPIWLLSILAIYLCVVQAANYSGERRVFLLLVVYLYSIMIAGNVVYTVPFLYLLWTLKGIMLVPDKARRVIAPGEGRMAAGSVVALK